MDDGYPEHLLPEHGGGECWCRPELYYEAANGAQVWIHLRDGDGPPLEALVAAIAAVAWGDDGAGA